MPQLSDEARARAAREQRSWRWVKRIAPIVISGSALGAGIVLTVGGVVFPPFAPFVFPLGIGVVALVGDMKEEAAGRKAQDPPRDDYWAETTVEVPELAALFDGNHPFELAVSYLLQIASEATAYERAMVIADERAEGAQDAGDDAAAKARLREAMDFGQKAAELDGLLRRHADRLAEILEEQEALREQAAVRGPDRTAGGALASALPNEAIARLAATGLDPRRLDIASESPAAIEDETGLPVTSDPIGALASALREAGQASQDYATQYREDFERGQAPA